MCYTGISLVVASRGCSLVEVCRLSLQWLLLWNTSSRMHGLLSLWGVGSVVVTPGL